VGKYSTFNGRREHLLASEHVLRQMHVEFFPTNRGRDLNSPGPGSRWSAPGRGR